MRGGRRTDLARRAVFQDEMREARLELRVAADKGVIVRVADLGCVFAVVQAVVARNFVGKAPKLGDGFLSADLRFSHRRDIPRRPQFCPRLQR